MAAAGSPTAAVAEKTALKGIPTTRKMFVVFLIMFGVGGMLCFIFSVISDGKTFQQMFSPYAPTDWFMDFFSSVRDCSVSEVYTARKVFYPPFCVVLLRCISYLFPSATLAGYDEESTSIIHADFISYIIYFIFAIICVIAISKMTSKYMLSKKHEMIGQVLSYVLIFSYPSLYSLERGNMTILALVFTMFFLFFKDSKNPIVSEFSYAALAFASGIKVYPALFGLLLLYEKKFKEAGRLIIYGVIVFIFPAVILCISDKISLVNMFGYLFNNFGRFSDKRELTFNLSSVSVRNVVLMLSYHNSFFNNHVDTFDKIAFYFTEALALCASYFAPKYWQKTFFLSYIILNISSISSSYLFFFIIMPFIIFLAGDGVFKKRDWFYSICFSLFLVPLPCVGYLNEAFWKKFFREVLNIYYIPRLNQLIAVWIFQFMFIFLFVDVVIYTVKRLKNKKSVSTPSDGAETPDKAVPMEAKA